MKKKAKTRHGGYAVVVRLWTYSKLLIVTNRKDQ